MKQYEEETNLRATVVLDVSRSMGWVGDAEKTLSKFDYAARLAAAVALILVRQRDQAGLIAYDEDIRALIEPRSRGGQWPLIAQTLGGLEPSGRTAAERALPRVAQLLRRRGLVVMISDLLVDRERSLQAMRYLRHRGHQVTVFHVMDPAEQDLQGPAEARYVDPETGDSVVASIADLRRAYRSTVAGAVAAWRKACRGSGIGYHHVLTDTPFGHALRKASGGSWDRGMVGS